MNSRQAVVVISATIILAVVSAAIIYTNKAVEQRQRTIDKQLNEIKQEAKQQSQQQKLEIEQKIKDLEAKLQAKKDAQEAQKRSLAQRVVDTIVPAAQAASAPYSGSHTDWMRAAGIPESEWTNVDFIVSRESGWNPNSVNNSSGACSLAQALPCSKIGPNWNDPVVALKWMTNYVTSRYGGWAGAVSWWNVHSWY